MTELQVILSAALALVALAIGFALGRSTSGRHSTAPEQSTPPTTQQTEEIKPAPEPTPFRRLSTLLFEGFRKVCEPIDSSLNFGSLSYDDVAKKGRKAIQDFKDAEYAFRMTGGSGTGQLVVARGVEMTNTHMKTLVEVLQTIARAREGKSEQFPILSYIDQLEQLATRLDEILPVREARQMVDDGIERSDSQSRAAGRVRIVPKDEGTNDDFPEALAAGEA